jgi:alcohol dehydrogenase YqhD (iron-dependent ADH family)
MKIRDLDIVVSEDVVGDFKKAISEVILYKNDKTEIARQSVTSTTVSFTNLNTIVAEGSEYMYVKLVSRKIGKDEAGKKS